MKVTIVKLTKEKLGRMPAKDRTLLLLLGNVSNEINVLQKLLLMGRKQDAGTRVVEIVEAGQQLVFLRMLIGKLHEGRVLLDKRVNGDKYFVERYGLRGEWAGKEQLKRVNKHFSESGALLRDVRNKVSFHSCDEDGLIEASFAVLSEDEQWDFYLTDTVANSFYYASELVVTRSAIGLTAAGKLAWTNRAAEAAALEELFDAALTAAGLLARVWQTLMVEIIDKSLDEQLDTEDVEIGQAARISEFHLPYFFEEEDLLRLRSTNATT